MLIFIVQIFKMMDWLSYNNKSVLMNYTDIGHSYASAYDLLQKHEQFHKNCFVSNHIKYLKIILNLSIF
jgi:hypothetical protein